MPPKRSAYTEQAAKVKLVPGIILTGGFSTHQWIIKNQVEHDKQMFVEVCNYADWFLGVVRGGSRRNGREQSRLWEHWTQSITDKVEAAEQEAAARAREAAAREAAEQEAAEEARLEREQTQQGEKGDLFGAFMSRRFSRKRTRSAGLTMSKGTKRTSLNTAFGKRKKGPRLPSLLVEVPWHDDRDDQPISFLVRQGKRAENSLFVLESQLVEMIQALTNEHSERNREEPDERPYSVDYRASDMTWCVKWKDTTTDSAGVQRTLPKEITQKVSNRRRIAAGNVGLSPDSFSRRKAAARRRILKMAHGAGCPVESDEIKEEDQSPEQEDALASPAAAGA